MSQCELPKLQPVETHAVLPTDWKTDLSRPLDCDLTP
jgi:hypothetical protein